MDTFIELSSVLALATLVALVYSGSDSHLFLGTFSPAFL